MNNSYVIPANVMFDKNLNASARVLYSFLKYRDESGLESLTYQEMAYIFDTTRQSIEQQIRKLRKNGYIVIKKIGRRNYISVL